VGIAEEVIEARACGAVRCGLSARPSPTPAELAAEFGLDPDPRLYREIDADSARRLVGLLLRTDMVWSGPAMPPDRAEQLAGRLLAEFGTDGARFFTNGLFDPPAGPPRDWAGAGWTPATVATFDAGILVVGPQRSGCLWVEDGD